MADKFEPGELFVYTNGDRWELGMVKRPNGRGDGYFCWYSRGDTAANTPTSCMHKLSNAGFTHIEQKLDDATVGAGTCKDLGGIGADGETVFHCSECGCVMSLFDKDGVNNLCTSFIYDYPRFCPECGKRIKEKAE